MSAPPTRRSSVRSTVATLATNVGVAVLSLFSVLVIARVLGPSGRGEFVFLIAVANLTHYLATMGVQEANVNFGTERRLMSTLGTNSVWLAFSLGLVAAGIVEGLISIFPSIGAHSDPGLRLFALGSIPVLILRNYLQRLVQAEYAFALTNSVWLMVPVVNLTGNGLLAALGGLTVGTAVATWVLGQALAVVVLVVFFERSYGFGAPDFGLARKALGFGLRAHAGDMMMIGNYRLDQWILGAVRSSRELGLYSVAVAWAEVLFFLPEAVKTVIRPQLVRASRRRAAEQTDLLFRLAMLLTAASATVIVIAAPLLTTVLFGARFAGSADQLRILAAGGFGIAAIKLLGSTLAAQRMPGLESVAAGVAFVTTVALDVLLIPGHGGIGASIASMVAYNIGGAAIVVIYLRKLGTSPRNLIPRRADLRLLLTRGSRVGGDETHSMTAAVEAAAGVPGGDSAASPPSARRPESPSRG